MTPKPSDKSGSAPSSVSKGKIVQDIVTAIHRLPGEYRVETNVWVPSLANAQVKREIDVLITQHVAGLDIRIAIECKNEVKIIKPDYMDAFCGKLQQLDIRHGIYVSASAYSRGAKERAKQAGIKLLNLEGLSKKGLPDVVTEVLQSIIFWGLQILKMSSYGDLYRSATSIFFIDDARKVCGAIPDLLWLKWREGTIPLDLGVHEVDISIPEDWQMVIIGDSVNSGKISKPLYTKEDHVVHFKYRIFGVILAIPGQVEQYNLIDAENGQQEHSYAKATFATATGVYPVTMITSVEELERVQQKSSASLHLLLDGFRLPRIRCTYYYWPPSERVLLDLKKRKKAFEEGSVPTLWPDDVDYFEGLELNAAFDPMWDRYLSMLKETGIG